MKTIPRKKKKGTLYHPALLGKDLDDDLELESVARRDDLIGKIPHQGKELVS